jgi:hypothetical protein
VCPRCETSTHYFSCSGGTSTDSRKNAPRHVTPYLFSHSVGSAGDVVHSVVSEMQNINALLFMLGCDWYGFHKKHVGTRYAKLVFLHPVESSGHVVHFGASGA